MLAHAPASYLNPADSLSEGESVESLLLMALVTPTGQIFEPPLCEHFPVTFDLYIRLISMRFKNITEAMC